MRYSAPFHVGLLHSQSSLGNLVLTKSGEPMITLPLSTLAGTAADGSSSQVFWHFATDAPYVVRGNDPNGTTRFRNYSMTSLGSALKAVMNAAATANSWPTSNFNVVWDETTLAYTFSYGSGFDFSFSTFAGSRLFGSVQLTATVTAASSHTLGELIPLYVHLPTVPFISVTPELHGFDYEPRGIGSRVHADDGSGYGNARGCSPLYRDWVQQFQSKAAQVRLYASGAAPWTMQHFFEYCRTVWPFLVARGGFGNASDYEIFGLREEGMAYQPSPHTVGNHAQTDTILKTISYGYMEAVI